MAEVVLSDALVNDLSELIDIPIYPVSLFAVDLGFDSAAASAAEQLAIQKQHPNEKYMYILHKFVATHGRGEEAAQDLIDRFKVKQKMLLVNFLEEAIKRQNALKQSGLAEGQRQTGTNVNARNKSLWKFVAGLSVVVALLSIVAACTWNIIFPEYIAENFSLEECQDTLRRHYKDHLFSIHTRQPWNKEHDVDLEKLYTTVSLYKQDKNNIPDESLQKSTLNGSVNDIFQTKVRGSLPERIVLFGEAGRGKSTAVAKMAFDWANKKEDSPLKDVKLLFVFKMRNMNAKTGITEAIIPLLGKKYKKYQKQLDNYIDSHEKDIVMLFDGYDEFSGKIRCGENVGDVIDILCQERCRRCRVLVTSRPVRKTEFMNLYYSKMVIEGYSQQQATYFIDKFFLSNETKGRKLKKHLEEDIVTNEMIATPLFCTMVCYLWNEGYIHGNFTRTKLFDETMEFLRTHLNAKVERDREIKQDLLNDTIVAVGQVAFRKLSYLNPLMFIEEDFSEVRSDILNSSYLLGLLIHNMKTDSDTSIQIEFFHKLAQEYSAGRYVASVIDEGKSIGGGFSIKNDITDILLFASGTSVSTCQILLKSKLEIKRHAGTSLDDFILKLIGEGETCADDFETDLTRYFKDGKLRLHTVTASIVVGFEKLPGSVKEKITTISIFKTVSSSDLFVRLWNSMNTCIHLTHMVMFEGVQQTFSHQMKPLYSVKSFSATLQQPDYYVQIMMFLPNLRELIIDPYRIFFSVPGLDISSNITDPEISKHRSLLAPTPTVLEKLWDQVNTSSLLNRLVLPIHADIAFNLKHLTSIHVYETCLDHVKSVSSLAHVLTFLPKVRELSIRVLQDVDEPNNKTEAFCELWKNLRTSPDLNRLLLPIPSSQNITCDLEPLRSVEVLETESSSIHLPIILKSLPNLQKLLLHYDIPEHFKTDYFWSVLHNLRELRHLEMNVPKFVHESQLKPLRSVQAFKTKIESQMKIFPILLSGLPSISELDILATDRKIAENNYFYNYYDKVISVIIDGLVKNGVQLKVLNMTFDTRGTGASKTASRDTVDNFIQMLKKSGTMQQLEIISFNYCVFNEKDWIEIITAIGECTSIMHLRIDCCLHSDGELHRFATQRHQTQKETQELNKIDQSGSLMLTLFDTKCLSALDQQLEISLSHIFPMTNSETRTGKRFVLPRSQ